jgi:hypothetical protein
VSVKLSRYIFRRIRGRLVPIRVGAAVREGVEGASAQAMRKLKAVMSQGASVGRTGKLRVAREMSGTDAMEKFMEKTGAIRFSKHDEGSAVLSFSQPLTVGQRQKLLRFVGNDEVIAGFHRRKGAGNGPVGGQIEDKNFLKGTDFLRSRMANMSSTHRSAKFNRKAADKLQEKAVKKFGVTQDPMEAGYIMRDGRALDLSGKNDGGTPGIRALDHREVSDIIGSPGYKPLSSKDARKLLRQAQLNRKQRGRQIHRATNIAQDLRKIRKSDLPRQERNEISKSLIEQLRRYKSRKGNK